MSRSIASSIRSFLERPFLLLLAPALAVLVNITSLWSGLHVDDLYHRIKFLGPPPDLPIDRATLFNLFTFNGPAINRRLADMGAFPWWTHAENYHAFFRPLSAATHAFDYTLYPNSPALMHAHSLLWYAGAAFAAALLYRRLLGPRSWVWAAGLAAVMYAVDDQHAMPAGWLANRNATVTAGLGFFSIYLHDRWRRDAWKPGPFAAPFVFGLALLAGESGTAASGYLFAYTLFIDPADRARNRWGALLPYALVGLTWALAYKSLGYGASGSELYVDPMSDPVRFLQSLAGAAPLFLLGQWAGPPPDIALFTLPEGLWVLRLLGLAFAGVMIYALAPLLRREPATRFWLLGMLISLVPISATFPASRLMLFVGLGGTALIAQIIALSRTESEITTMRTARRRITYALASFFLVYHVALAPVLALVNQSVIPQFGAIVSSLATQLPSEPELNNKTVTILNLPTPMLATYVAIGLYLDGKPYPPHVRVLASSNDSIEIERIDERSLRLRPERGFFPPPNDPAKRKVAYRVPFMDFAHAMERFGMLTRDRKHPVALGESFVFTGLTIKVTGLTADGRPAEILATFDRPLEDESILWFCWKDAALAPATLPAKGERLTLEAERLIF